MNKNAIFQTLYSVIRPARKERDSIEFTDYDRRWFTQARLANLFGGAHIVLWGNSNIEFLNSREVMSGFSRLAVNFGLAGSTAIQLCSYWLTQAGKELQALTWKPWRRPMDVASGRLDGRLIPSHPMEVINAFGNHVIARQMHTVDVAIKEVKARKPEAIVVGPPPVHTSILSSYGSISRQVLDNDLLTLNSKLRDSFGKNFVNMYDALKDPRTGEAYPGALADPIHYSQSMKQYYVKMINHIYAERYL